jgi:hypothetical protein
MAITTQKEGIGQYGGRTRDLGVVAFAISTTL